MFLTNKRIYRLAMIFLVALGLGLISSPGWADDSNKSRQQKNDIPAGVEMVNTVILKKVITYRESPGKVYEEDLDVGEVIDKKIGVVLVKRQKGKKKGTKVYRFNSFVEVFNGKKRRISMDDLPVPCQAKLYYYPSRGKDPYLYRIEVVRAHKGARKRWHEEFRDL